MRVHIVYTGGTIGMKTTPTGLAPGADMRGWLNEVIDDSAAGVNQVSFAELNPLIDSSNATPDNWQAIANNLNESRNLADAFVVLHGTDTMSYTAAALSYALCNFGKPIVITGSQLPLGENGSDAKDNVIGAINSAASGGVCGVCLFFGGKLFAGNRTTKHSSWAFEAFVSPSFETLDNASSKLNWEDAQRTSHGWSNPLPFEKHDVAVVNMVPGISANRVRAAISPLPEAIIVRAYGVGNIPADEPGLVELFANATSNNVAVIVSTQCAQARVHIGRYETGDAIAKAGAQGTADMTFEAAYAKTVFLLSQGLRGNELASWMTRSIAGELSEQS